MVVIILNSAVYRFVSISEAAMEQENTEEISLVCKQHFIQRCGVSWDTLS